MDKGIPFFIAIHLTVDTLKSPWDYWIFFLGGTYESIDTGEVSFQLGEFYQNQELDNLIGLLIYYNEQFYWLKNPRCKTRLEFKNVKLECK